MTNKSTGSGNSALSASRQKWAMRANSLSPKRLVRKYAEHNLDESAVKILSARKVSHEDAKTFLNPTRENSLLDSYGIRRMNKAVDFIINALNTDKKIAILGDYDVDGCTGTAILERFFRDIGLPQDKLVTYIPHRINEGYGPNSDAIRKLHARGVNLIITVDCGTTSFESLKLAKELGMKVIVTDHHKPDKNTVYPEGAEIVNPNRKDNKTLAEIARKYQVLVGAGVAYLLCEALFDRLEKPQGKDKDLFASDKPVRAKLFDKLIALAALGTLCDVAPLTGINRWILKEGLRVMNHWQYELEQGKIQNWPIPGLQYLAEVSGLKGKKINEQDLGFQLGPRLNAAGRLDNGINAKNLLSADNLEEARTIAGKLEELNTLRKATQEKIFDEARKQAEEQVKQGKSVIVVSQKDWHEGVIGIVAGKLKEIFSLPVCVITIDEKNHAKGSARSIEGVDIGDAVISALHGEKPLLNKGGGHTMAAGFSMDADNIPAFHEYLIKELSKPVAKSSASRALFIDDVIAINDITPNLVLSYGKLAPFGRHNEPLRVVVSDVKIIEAKIIGRNNDTLKLSLRDAKDSSKRMDAILFKKASTPLGILLRSFRQNDTFQLAGSVTTNIFQGAATLQLEIDDAYIGKLEEIIPPQTKMTHAEKVIESRKKHATMRAINR